MKYGKKRNDKQQRYLQPNSFIMASFDRCGLQNGKEALPSTQLRRLRPTEAEWLTQYQ